MVPILWKSYFPLHWETWFHCMEELFPFRVDNIVPILWKSYFPLHWTTWFPLYGRVISLYIGQHGSHSIIKMLEFLIDYIYYVWLACFLRSSRYSYGYQLCCSSSHRLLPFCSASQYKRKVASL
jgi:hypothetical protein